MKRDSSFPLLILVLFIAVAFELLSAASLPSAVASHFGGSGDANGFMARRSYLGFMLTLTVCLPLLLALAHGSVRWIRPRYMNIPNRDYWLAPERVDETYAFLQSRGTYFAMMVAAFVAFMHWLVVRANAVQPAHLSEPLFVTGVGVFVAALLFWIATFIFHFRRS